MTVSTISSRVVYNGDGAATTFAFAFKVPLASELVVVYTDTLGDDFTLTSGDYTVTGLNDDAGGTVTYPTVASGDPAIALGTRLTIWRDVPLTQPTSISNQGAMWPQVIEAAFDRVTMVAQQLQDQLDRALLVDISEANALDLLPSADERADSVLGFDGDGQPYAAQIDSSVVAWSTWVLANWRTVASAAAGRALLSAVGLTGNETVAGNKSFSGTTAITGTLDATSGRAKAPTRTANDSGTDAATTAFVANALAVLGGSLIRGLTYQNNAGDATNDLDIAAGGCMDGGGTYLMSLAALTKQSDVAWAVGSAAGGLDTGSVGNSDYYIWAIARSDTGVTDILFSLSSTAPTMPASYDKKRLIGWFKRSGGTIVAFKTYETEGGGIRFGWAAPRVDVSLANTLTTARRTDALSVPLLFAVEADIVATASDASTGSAARICCPDETDAAPSAPGSTNIGWSTGTTGILATRIRTSATGTLAARALLATVDAYTVVTNGFLWSRR